MEKVKKKQNPVSVYFNTVEFIQNVLAHHYDQYFYESITYREKGGK